MKTYYIPSSYRGKKHRRALMGGCLRGYDVIENGKEITLVNPVEAIEKLPPKLTTTITRAESTNQPVEIKKPQLSLFSAITHDAKKGVIIFLKRNGII